MSDLARDAAEAIAGVPWELSIEATERIINECGTLVSHEDAALLDALKRLEKHGGIINIDHEEPGLWIVEARNRGMVGYAYAERQSPHEAIISALDAAGVPKDEVPS